jgi:CTP-dependent riboflavin kinase
MSAVVRRLRGRVAGGRGDLAHWMTVYAEAYQRVTGLRLFPGSLDVVLDHEYHVPEDRLRIEPADLGGRVGMHLGPCTIGGRRGFFLRTDQNEAGTGHPGRHVVEVAVAVHLDQTRALADGDMVEIVVGG